MKLPSILLSWAIANKREYMNNITTYKGHDNVHTMYIITNELSSINYLINILRSILCTHQTSKD